MDQLIEGMVNGLKGTYQHLANEAGPEHAVELKAVVDQIAALAEANANDYAGYFSKLTASKLMDDYNAKVTKLCEVVKAAKKDG